MTGEELLERLLRSYRQSFDIERPYVLEGEEYDAYGAFDVTSAKYVLTKKAELWRAQCYEHVFFRRMDVLTEGELDRFRRQIVEYIEPNMVRHGEKCPPENHMYTFVTGIYISEEGISQEVIHRIKRFKYMKNYRFTIRGYCDARLLVFDMKNKKIYGNLAAKDLIKGYKKIF